VEEPVEKEAGGPALHTLAPIPEETKSSALSRKITRLN